MWLSRGSAAAQRLFSRRRGGGIATNTTTSTTTTRSPSRPLTTTTTTAAAAAAAMAPTPAPTPAPMPTHPASAAGVEVFSGPPLTVLRVPVLSDNYVWLLRDHEKDVVAVVDPAEAAPVADALAAAARDKGWPARLDFILNTHHHFDHVGGNLELKKRFPGCKVVGPKADAGRIPGIDVAVGDGDGGGGGGGGVGGVFSLGGLEMVALDTPGHTRGHVCLWFPAAKCLFTGDTVFALGCGRLFEGDAPTMWSSMLKLRDGKGAAHSLGGVPQDTRVFCAHEYSQSNARFAAQVADPTNAALQERKRRIDEARARGHGTVPFWWGEELEANPFLRADQDGVREAAGVVGGEGEAADVETFRRVRAAKDSFR